MASSTLSPPPLLGAVLVIGGCGFLGYHLVRVLLEDPECGPVYVLDVRISNNIHPRANYISGSITDVETVDAVLKKIQPEVIFHAASPNPTYPTSSNRNFFYETNVKGTEILLTAATESESVKAFVFTSSVDIYAHPPHNNITESHALCSTTPTTSEYARTKSIAHTLVLAAISPNLRTVSLLNAHMYGERCSQGIPAALDACSGNQRLFQIGDGNNLVEVLSVGNAVTAHILAAKALLDPTRASGEIDGEAFNISDGHPVPFWEHVKKIWTFARGKNAEVTVLPGWIAFLLLWIMEWAYWIFTLGTKQPPGTMGRTSIEYCVYDHTYSIEKVRERLGFRPVGSHDEVLRGAVEWELNRRRELGSKK